MSTATQNASGGESQGIDMVEAMHDDGLPETFIFKALNAASESNAIRGLLELWTSSEEEERDEIVADIQDLLDDWARVTPSGPEEEVYVRFDDLETIAEDIMSFKNSLLAKLEEENVTLTELSGKTGMPVSSLSRFFNTPSMPRRATLLKIAKAVDFSAVEIATDWDY